MAKFVIVKEAEVEKEVVAKVANDFAEWLDSQGWQIERKDRSDNDSSYQELAEVFARHVESGE